MRDKKMELELSVVSDDTNYEHKILGRTEVELLTKAAQQDIENE